MPDGLGCAGGGHLEDIRLAGADAGEIVFDVAVVHEFSVAAKEAVETGVQNLVEHEGRRFGALIDLEDRDGGIETGWCAALSTGDACGEEAVVAVVQQAEREDA
jgi:hypothetical protein